MIRLDKKNFQKLRGLIIERDSELWELYEEYLEVPFPRDAVHIHHVKPKGSGGEDKEDNLIALSPEVHLMHFHTGYGSVVKEYQKKAQAYLESEEVQEWRESHMNELEGIYRTSDDTRARKIRNGCLPKKRPGLPF